jgi:hypothetical protein
MTLDVLQRRLVDHILRGTQEISNEIRGDAVPRRLAVYHKAYRMQLLACLRDTFEKTWSWLGDEPFDAAGLQHIEKHPPTSWTLSDYGHLFAKTLRELYPQDPEVAELAWLDWTLRRAFDGPNAPSLSADRFASVDWEKARLHLVPTLRVASIATNCAAIWTSIAEQRVPPAVARLETPTALRVWRHELTPKFRSIGPEEHQALRLTIGGHRFSAICEHIALGRDAQAASQAAGAMLALWLQDGLIAEVD